MEKKQLEIEMDENSWIVAENNLENKILGKATTHFWKEQIKGLGGEYLVWFNAPEDPCLN